MKFTVVIGLCFILAVESASVDDWSRAKAVESASVDDWSRAKAVESASVDDWSRAKAVESASVDDWSRAKAVESASVDDGSRAEAETLGPIGYIYQRTSGKAIHPDGGSANPSDNTNLVIHSGTGVSRLQLRFIPQPQYGHFGYIQHVSSGKYVHPSGGSAYPGDNTELVFHQGSHYGTLFSFDEATEQIVHIGGKNWHPDGGSVNPGDNTGVVLHQGQHAATRFYLGDAYGNKLSAYPDPNLSGTWELVRAYLTPKVTHIYSETYTIGRSHTSSVTTQHAWSVSIGATKGLFSASAEYSGFVSRTSEESWSTMSTISRVIEVPAGDTVATWQFIYRMSQFNEVLTFHSNIIGDTNSIYTPPTLSTARQL